MIRREIDILAYESALNGFYGSGDDTVSLVSRLGHSHVALHSAMSQAAQGEFRQIQGGNDPCFDSLKEIDDAEPLLAHLENHVLAVRLFASRNVALSSFHRAQCVLLLSDALHLEVSGRLNEHFHRGPHYNCMFPYG